MQRVSRAIQTGRYAVVPGKAESEVLADWLASQLTLHSRSHLLIPNHIAPAFGRKGYLGYYQDACVISCALDPGLPVRHEIGQLNHYQPTLEPDQYKISGYHIGVPRSYLPHLILRYCTRLFNPLRSMYVEKTQVVLIFRQVGP